MNFILFDDHSRKQFLPLTFTRPVADLRIGILTIREKWEKMLNEKTSTFTENYLAKKFPIEFAIDEDNFWINATVCPNEILINEIKKLEKGQALYVADLLIALNSGNIKEIDFSSSKESYASTFESHAHPLIIRHVYDLFLQNKEAIEADFKLLTSERMSHSLGSGNQTINTDQIFLEEGAKVNFSILNASTGPIYIGKDAEVMEGCMIRGPFALGDHAALKMGTKIYGATTVGPHSKVGGEVNNSIISGFSNKAHDGFLGNSVIGEWCNLGADTNNSNLKNNYANVKIWNYASEKMEDTGLQFCGLIMGDHSKSGINTMFNTGTVVGVCANVFGAGFPDTHIPSFCWGGAESMSTYNTDKALETAKIVFSRRNLPFSNLDKELLLSVFEQTLKYRSWEFNSEKERT